ncbi:beta-ketoacyl-ACP synthase II [Micromonospora sp. WMMD1120]|uniref:beta-ketoacyl-ACP synthase II n=1 Tax=Micromonospora sp. WMMD1120 TaxID=3016106 RepID=UPI002416F504|nr:beta-ketoacyl-ACP synthase II [Micromonospora sp. WMMD1120]MDG4810071.1 beta-ketoacyl-ACP synthase II [Micromonospora sp. WMMD1120]
MTRRVVVTGIGVVSPVGSGKAFWPALLAGRSGIGAITGFDAADHPVRIAGEVRDVELREWLEVKDVARLDRVCHLALVAAGMAIQDAAFDHPDPDRVGVVFGTAIGGAETMRQGVIAEHDRGARYVSPLFVVTGIPNMATALVSTRFGFRGPSFTTVTACSSSADAIGWGARMVRDGYADACLAGGAEAAVCPPILASFAQLRALSRRNDEATAASRPFDADRDGFVIAEGAAALVLESEESARRRAAPIYAEIAGYGQSSDAYHETAPDPSGRGAARAVDAALVDAGALPGQIGYVNAHGTGTRLSDAAETAALKRAFGAHAYRLAVSSTKSMTGHMLGAAGAVEAAATALALRDGVLPPTINLTRPDPDCDLDYVPGTAREHRADAAISLSMGFGGHNSCLALRKVDDGT